MLSIEQINIINTIKENKNVICDAVAGSGKTTTILELVRHIVKYKYIQSDSFERDRLFYYKVRPENILDYLHTKYPSNLLLF
jgi:ATP-dependent exoDNAse (exonuclease V) beta subunit